jgi:hypothetical protein
MRMRDRDTFDSAHGVDHFDRRAVNERYTVPHDIAVRGTHKHGALTDAEMGERQ